MTSPKKSAPSVETAATSQAPKAGIHAGFSPCTRVGGFVFIVAEQYQAIHNKRQGPDSEVVHRPQKALRFALL